jgi:hypothetical protein
MAHRRLQVDIRVRSTKVADKSDEKDNESGAPKVGGLEIEDGPAVAGPGEAYQYVAPLDTPREPVVRASRVPSNTLTGRVFNVSDEEIERQRLANDATEAARK